MRQHRGGSTGRDRRGVGAARVSAFRRSASTCCGNCGRSGKAGHDAAMSRVELSSAERVLFPDDGITKGDLFAYYERVAPVIVPHLRDRPFTMKRYREGA